MKTETLTREFRYNGAKLTDPSPAFSLQQVRDFYGNTYPEIVNAEIDGPEVVGNKNVFTFRRAVGTKGAGMTLDQLRAELERGPLQTSGKHHIDAQSANGALAHRLLALASRSAAGVRLSLPVSSMPVLP
jgi:PRTRC genetic system protein C